MRFASKDGSTHVFQTSAGVCLLFFCHTIQILNAKVTAIMMDLLVHTVDLSYSWNAVSDKYPIATTSQKKRKKRKDSTDKQQETKYSGTKVCPKLQLTFSRLFFKSEPYIVRHSGSQLHSGSQHQAWPCGPGCPWVFSQFLQKWIVFSLFQRLWETKVFMWASFYEAMSTITATIFSLYWGILP